MSACLTVYRDGEVWRWRYTEPRPDADPFVLDAAPAHPEPDAAEEAARTAYPGVPVRIQRPRGWRSVKLARLLLRVLRHGLFLLLITVAVLARLRRRPAG